MLSAKESDATITDQSEGRSLEMIQVSAAPIDGLTVTGSFVETSAIGAATGSEDGIAAAVNAKYTIGQVSLGYAENGYQPATGAAVDDPTIYYDNKFYGISFAVNDALSVSYNMDESEKNTRAVVAAGATAGTKTITAMEQKSIQAAYTVGGATLGIAQVEVSNADYSCLLYTSPSPRDS